MGKPRDNYGKPWDSCGKPWETIGKLFWEHYGITMENDRKTMGKAWEDYEKL